MSLWPCTISLPVVCRQYWGVAPTGPTVVLPIAVLGSRSGLIVRSLTSCRELLVASTAVPLPCLKGPLSWPNAYQWVVYRGHSELCRLYWCCPSQTSVIGSLFTLRYSTHAHCASTSLHCKHTDDELSRCLRSLWLTSQEYFQRCVLVNLAWGCWDDSRPIRTCPDLSIEWVHGNCNVCPSATNNWSTNSLYSKPSWRL